MAVEFIRFDGSVTLKVFLCLIVKKKETKGIVIILYWRDPGQIDQAGICESFCVKVKLNLMGKILTLRCHSHNLSDTVYIYIYLT